MALLLSSLVVLGGAAQIIRSFYQESNSMEAHADSPQRHSAACGRNSNLRFQIPDASVRTIPPAENLCALQRSSPTVVQGTEKRGPVLCVIQLSTISFQPSCGLSATAFTAYCLLKQRGWETF
jgi:hypothetical protein